MLPCPRCGEPVRDPQVYCSVNCRTLAAYRERRGLPVSDFQYTTRKVCPACRRTFPIGPRSKTRVYCSETCAWKTQHRRQKERKKR